MRIRRSFLPRFFVFFLIAVSASGADNHTSLTLDPGPFPFKFVAYGDMRMTDTSNHRDSDPERRQAIIDGIAQQRPKFVLISGDLVLNGSSAADWAEYDKEMKPVLDAGAAVYPTLGNHDLRGNTTTALSNYFQRFPQLNQSRYYTVRAGNVLVVALDTAQAAPNSPERLWLGGVLRDIPRQVEFVVFCMHHPPYTNFTLTMAGHSARGQERKLAGYLEEQQKASRARFLVIAGHNHNYERYEHNGVMYIVSGGGGATPYMPRRGPTDFYQGRGPTYHYCLISMEPGKLNFEMYKLTQDLGHYSWQKADNFALTVAGVQSRSAP